MRDPPSSVSSVPSPGAFAIYHLSTPAYAYATVDDEWDEVEDDSLVPEQQQEHQSNVLDVPIKAEPHAIETELIYHAEAQVVDHQAEQKKKWLCRCRGAVIAAMIVIVVAIVVVTTAGGSDGGERLFDNVSSTLVPTLPPPTGAPTLPQPTTAPTSPWDECFTKMGSLRNKLRARTDYDTPVEVELCKCAPGRTAHPPIVLGFCFAVIATTCLLLK